MSNTARRNRMFAVQSEAGPLVGRALTYREAESAARQHVQERREAAIIRKRNVVLSRIAPMRDGSIRIDMTVEGSAHA